MYSVLGYVLESVLSKYFTYLVFYFTYSIILHLGEKGPIYYHLCSDFTQ